jgi:hypothetical protein
MTMPRTASLLVGLAAGLFAALWLGTSARDVLSIVQAVAVIASAAVAALATAMGGLMVSDWQAEAQSRRDWAQLGLAPAELSTPAPAQTAWDIDQSNHNSADNAALRQIFRTHRAVPPVQPESIRAVVAGLTPASLGSEHANHIEELSRDGLRHHALRGAIVASNVRMLPAVASHRAAKLHVKRTVLPARLVANGRSWQGWVAHQPSTPTRVALSAESTGEIVTLGSSGDVQARQPSEVGGMIDPATEAPSCRGPPVRHSRSSHRRLPVPAHPAIKREAPTGEVVARTDPVVRDDLGQPVPVCAAELEVIEVYMGHVLSDLLASSITQDEGA